MHEVPFINITTRAHCDQENLQRTILFLATTFNLKSPMFQIKKKLYETHLIVLTLIGEFDQKVKQEFLHEIQSAQEVTPQQIFVNLVNVSYIDCTALGSLVLAHTSSVQLQIEFLLIMSQGHIQQALELAELEKVIPVLYSDPHQDFPLK